MSRMKGIVWCTDHTSRTRAAGKRIPWNQLSLKYAQTMRRPVFCSKARMRAALAHASSAQKPGKAAW